jgi:hypothetical protein
VPVPGVGPFGFADAELDPVLAGVMMVVVLVSCPWFIISCLLASIRAR